MIHPLVRLAASHPELLAEHGEAYLALVARDLAEWRASLVRRIVMAAVAGVAALLSLVFIGIALMLWGIAPVSHIPAPWAFFAPPVLMVVVTMVAGFIAARRGKALSIFSDVKAQVLADLAMLREVKAK